MSSTSGSLSSAAEKIVRDSAAESADAPLIVALAPIFSDNYVYLLRDAATGQVGVVDPGDAAPVSAALNVLGWRPDWIILTHHHPDHIAGVDALREETGAKVVGAAQDAHRLPALDATVAPGDAWSLGETRFDVIDAPGHTVGQIAWAAPKARAVFTGDSLFALGCGRLFEGTPAQMWETLLALRALDDATRVYCGHEYTLSNARFCLTIEPDNAALQERAAQIEAAREAGAPTIPTTIGEEKATNSFLRADEPSVQAAVDLTGADAAAVFAEIRRRKDNA
ncbi:MAG: hydroxyacylglutathione hydrolase [Pseudomonadota bacterium]